MTTTINGSSPSITFSDGSAQTSATRPFQNRIINGAMVINQRALGTVTVDSSVYTTDRWQANQTAAGKYSVQNSATAPTGFTNSYLATSLSAYSVSSSDIFFFQQNIEGYNIADLGWGTASAATVTLSFRVRSSLTGTFGGALANSAHNRSYPFSYTISAADTWETKSITIAGDTSGTWLTTNGIGIQVIFGLGGGSTRSGTAGAWAASTLYTATGATSVVGTNGATFYITGVQLEVGSTATSFDYRPYTTELQLCQRYYYKVTASAANDGFSAGGQCYNTTGAVLSIPFPVTMRTTPTALEQSGTAGDYRLFGAATNGITCSSVPTFNGTTNQNIAVVEGTVASGLVAGNSTFIVAVNTSAYLAWSAEL